MNLNFTSKSILGWAHWVTAEAVQKMFWDKLLHNKSYFAKLSESFSALKIVTILSAEFAKNVDLQNSAHP